MASDTPKFRLAKKRFFLTLPRADPTKTLDDLFGNMLVAHRGYRGTKPIPHRFIVCKESHADGTPHWHALLEFSRVINVKDSRYFDCFFFGQHCNIGAVRNYKATIRYVCKAGVYRSYNYPSGFLESVLKSPLRS